jgi:hypothetical protein
MGVTVSLPLFANPGQELEEGAAVKGQQLRDLAADLTERLHQAADALDRLTAAGWSCQVAMYELLLFHNEVRTREEAALKLRALGIDPSSLMIVEDVEQEKDEADDW